MTSGSVCTTLAGTEWQLFAARAAFCPAQDTLFVADPHLGKDATFRRHGFPVPLGSSGGTLQTISRLLVDTNASRLVILGDLFHARSSLTTETVAAVESFFAEHPSVEFLLVEGNHDAHVGNLPLEWPIRTVAEGERMGQLALSHHPGSVPDGAALLLCGHLHPAIRIGSGRESFGKLPCFWYSSGCLVFPAIGEFTGTHVVQPQNGDRTWLVADNEIIEL
ncbi:ligase-associated DNA damage response endonuclease PdeM [Rhodopirellula sp. P2]|uniref:ligase-associated DNA damage response endonuclease PdeM n=1 Tax=Rhodopirellula sp. P2 TaxID=2127060 RepID=UPI002368EEE0|nr:ligase-associated DNA damage response endonuclease PdeM [Rhodopirellula sp. P2]WDQ15347.1 ligase-associated DNA damage response endonuclease PdeM [Rhodopirellula sp. P2]